MTKDKLIIKESREILEDLEIYFENTNNWEQSFIESLSDQLDKNEQISPKQYNKLKELYYKYIS